MSPLIGKITVVHPENLNTTAPAVYAVSHQSSIDFVLIGSMIRNFVSISNHPISDFWLFFKVPRLVGVYYMKREDPNASIAVYNRLGKALNAGVSVFLFPEGTRNYSRELKPFQKGAFRLSIDNNVPVIPVVIQGTGKIVTKGSNLNKTFNRTDISVTYLEPVYPEAGEKVRDLSARVRSIMQAEVERSFA
jgi:1-acyl-sn-glycerol-3-phosphate acyltransferase